MAIGPEWAHGRAMRVLTRSALLFENGLPDLPALLVEAHRNPGGIWRIKFSYETSEPLSMSAEIVALIGARNSFKTNAQAFRVEDELSKSTISLLA